MANGGMGGMGGFDMMGMLKQAQEQAAKMQEKIQGELANKTVEGSTGGGLVSVTISGDLEVRRVKIDPSLMEASEKDMLEDLIAAATNVAIKKAKALEGEAQQGQLGNMLGGLGGGGGMPDLGSLLGGLGGM
ncbi:MAG: YbaB/EbfC family nucleoid-associated protein [Planctomycetes bacterium]|nr:YbaB/EbfC family nucleoid-associated protein [Planctomycetota bacterium]